MQFFENLFRSLEAEMNRQFTEVNHRLARIDSTLVLHGQQLAAGARQLAAGARAIAGLSEWVGKADGDYLRVLAELSELKQRVAKLEGQGGE